MTAIAAVPRRCASWRNAVWAARLSVAESPANGTLTAAVDTGTTDGGGAGGGTGGGDGAVLAEIATPGMSGGSGGPDGIGGMDAAGGAAAGGGGVEAGGGTGAAGGVIAGAGGDGGGAVAACSFAPSGSVSCDGGVAAGGGAAGAAGGAVKGACAAAYVALARSESSRVDIWLRNEAASEVGRAGTLARLGYGASAFGGGGRASLIGPPSSSCHQSTGFIDDCAEQPPSSRARQAPAFPMPAANAAGVRS